MKHTPPNLEFSTIEELIAWDEQLQHELRKRHNNKGIALQQQLNQLEHISTAAYDKIINRTRNTH